MKGLKYPYYLLVNAENKFRQIIDHCECQSNNTSKTSFGTPTRTLIGDRPQTAETNEEKLLNSHKESDNINTVNENNINNDFDNYIDSRVSKIDGTTENENKKNDETLTDANEILKELEKFDSEYQNGSTVNDPDAGRTFSDSEIRERNPFYQRYDSTRSLPHGITPHHSSEHSTNAFQQVKEKPKSNGIRNDSIKMRRISRCSSRFSQRRLSRMKSHNLDVEVATYF